jgi:transcriptional regulator EpsA
MNQKEALLRGQAAVQNNEWMEANEPGAPLSPRQSEALVRCLEGAAAVRRRHHFFVWTQGHMRTLLPHQNLICGAYQRHSGEMAFEVFNSTVLTTALLASLSDRRSALIGGLTAAWIEGGAQPLALQAARLKTQAQATALQLQEQCGAQSLLVHGVARPQRSAEIESFFVFASTTAPDQSAQNLRHLELLLPHLHNAWQRVQAAEFTLKAGPSMGTLPSARSRSAVLVPKKITGRELQVLQWVRNGKSNQQIGDGLGISPLTVKNHIQKILRKLGANNRAQAVALAMLNQGLDASQETGRTA